MDTFGKENLDIKPKKSLLFIHLVSIGLGIFFFIAVGMTLEKGINNPCDKAVLGINSSNTLANRLALLLNNNIERPSYDTKHFQIIPTSTPIMIQLDLDTTPTPTPENTEDEDQDLMWAGSNRNPKPTATPSPNNVITVPNDGNSPEENDTGGEEGPTPTDKYYAVWDRNRTPTPTKSNLKMDDLEKLRPEGSPLSDYTSQNINQIPEKIQNLLDVPGLTVDDLEIVRSEKNEGIKVNGMIRERFFGLLSVSYPISIVVNESSGEIEPVILPWWRVLFGNPFKNNLSRIVCGDGICSSKENYDVCKTDCAPVCGNGICEYGEGQDTCPIDCDLFPTATPTSD